MPLICLILILLLGSCGAALRNSAEQPEKEEGAGPGPAEAAANEGRETQEAAPQPVHPAFSIGEEALAGLLDELPEEAQAAIKKRPQYFLELVDQVLQLPRYLTVLVDKNHSLPEEYEPERLAALDGYPLVLNKSGLSLHAGLMPDLLAMNEAAAADGVRLVISSSYRSYDYQKGLYERFVVIHGKEEADRFSARPGTSQHQLGTAIDFGSITEKIAETGQGRWLAARAWEFGFSLSYPKNGEELTGYMWEPWHFRYISRTAARLQREFFADSQQHMLEFLHARRGYFEAARSTM